MRKTELLEIGCLEATKKMLKFFQKRKKKNPETEITKENENEEV